MNLTDVTLTDTQKELLHELNPRQQKFVFNLMEGMNQTEAYKNAGYKPQSDRVAESKAARLVSNGKVKAAYDALSKPVAENRAKRAIVTRDDAIEAMSKSFIACQKIHEVLSIIEVDEETEFGIKKKHMYLMEDPEKIPLHIKEGFKDIVATSRGPRPIFHDMIRLFESLAKAEGWIKASEADGAASNALVSAYEQIVGKTKGRPPNDE